MEAKDFLEEIDYYNTNVEGELYEKLGIETLADILEVYHQRKLKLLGIADVVGQNEQLVCKCDNIIDRSLTKGKSYEKIYEHNGMAVIINDFNEVMSYNKESFFEAN